MNLPRPSAAAREALAPTAVLRAGINLSNFLLVSTTSASTNGDVGEPDGVSPAIARALGEHLDVPVELVFFDNPGEVADAATENRWDIGNIGADPARSEHIAFSSAYSQIECTYLVRQESPIETMDEVDRPGIRVVSKERAAYTLVLERDLKNAELIQTASIDGAFEAFVDDDLDVLAGLLPRLLSDADALPGARILDGSFATVQQAIGTPRDRDPAGVQYLDEFVTAALASGLVADLIDHYQVTGLSAAPLP